MDDFLDFIGFRNMLVESRINQCLDGYKCGEFDITIDSAGLTEQEASYAQREVLRRIEDEEY